MDQFEIERIFFFLFFLFLIKSKVSIFPPYRNLFEDQIVLFMLHNLFYK